MKNTYFHAPLLIYLISIGIYPSTQGVTLLTTYLLLLFNLFSLFVYALYTSVT